MNDPSVNLSAFYFVEQLVTVKKNSSVEKNYGSQSFTKRNQICLERHKNISLPIFLNLTVY